VAIAVPPAPRALPSVPTRRSVELVPELALAWPHCASGEASNDRCDGVRGGAGGAFSAFWRFSPYVAAGGGLEIAGFRYEPPAHLNLTSSNAVGVFLGFLGRAYFLDHGSVDPYAQLGIGGGGMGTGGRRAGQHFEETGAGPALQLGGGVDFFVSSILKLGPSVSYTHVFVDKIRHCEGSSDDCSDISTSQSGHLDSFFTVGVRLTILLGGEM
jgi:opacity protein-like surface antigen